MNILYTICVVDHGYYNVIHTVKLDAWNIHNPLRYLVLVSIDDRVIIFAVLVDDPGNDLPEDKAAQERERLFRIIEELGKWENTTNGNILEIAEDEIRKCTKGRALAILDPFCGAG